MQTFLPYANFQQTVECLDWRRLGKQRVEARQILDIISPDYKKKAWANHPATQMWRGYEIALGHYSNLCIREWINRGYNNTMEIVPIHQPITLPPWIGDDDFHASHRSNLLRKSPEWYNRFGWDESPDLPYVWPVN